MTAQDFGLERRHFDTETWDRLAAFMQARRQELREANDSPQKGEIDTAVLRGKILMLKELLDLAKPKPA